MKNTLTIFFLSLLLQLPSYLTAQNVGVGVPAPLGKLHIKGSDNVTQLIIDADTNQTNLKPLVRLRSYTGSDLLWLHSDHPENVFLGNQAGRLNIVTIGTTTGLYNTFLGSQAGYTNKEGSANTAIGAHALYTNNIGFNNTATGADALFQNVTGSSNTGIGNSALFSNISGSENTALGKSSLYQNTKAGHNTAVGYQSLYSQSFNPGTTWNSDNVAIGYRALFHNEPTTISNGVNNTAVGTEALYENTHGTGNTAVGKSALAGNTSMNQNTAIGYQALYTQSFDPSALFNPGNVAIGYQALYSNQPGEIISGIYNGFSNTGIGTNSLHENTTGFNNTACGHGALYHNTGGNGNSAFGVNALRENSLGGSNIAIGYYSLANNTSASENIAIGFGALSSQDFDPGVYWASNNIAIGIGALSNNNPTTVANGNNNTAVGDNALYWNSIGYENTAIGTWSLYHNTTGDHNNALGEKSLYNTTSGTYNTAIGDKAAYSNTTGDLNTSCGAWTLINSTTGDGNSAYGHAALTSLDEGSDNTAVGIFSLGSCLHGDFNTAIGSTSGVVNRSNTTSLGYQAGGIVSANNRVEIGNTSVTWIGGQVGWSTYSDERIKENIQANVPGLDFINRLRPVTYNLNIHRENTLVYTNKKPESEWESKFDIEKIRMSGFIAQEVAQAAIETGYDFSGVEKPEDPNELYSLRYADFVMPLVKAVQELSNQNAEKDALIGDLTLRIERLEALLQNRD